MTQYWRSPWLPGQRFAVMISLAATLTACSVSSTTQDTASASFNQNVTISGVLASVIGAGIGASLSNGLSQGGLAGEGTGPTSSSSSPNLLSSRRPGQEAVVALLRPSTPPRSRDGTFGILLLPRGEERNFGICRAFFNRFEAVSDPSAFSRIPNQLRNETVWEEINFRPTFWPVNDDQIEMQATTCSRLLERYDWRRANAELARVGMAGASGPVLLGIGSSSEGRDDLNMIVFDLSRTPDSQIPRAFRIWRHIITAEPTRWAAMQSHIGLREEIRNALIANSATLTTYLLPRAIAARAGLNPDVRPPDSLSTMGEEEIRFRTPR